MYTQKQKIIRTFIHIHGYTHSVIRKSNREIMILDILKLWHTCDHLL